MFRYFYWSTILDAGLLLLTVFLCCAFFTSSSTDCAYRLTTFRSAFWERHCFTASVRTQVADVLKLCPAIRVIDIMRIVPYFRWGWFSFSSSIDLKQSTGCTAWLVHTKISSELIICLILTGGGRSCRTGENVKTIMCHVFPQQCSQLILKYLKWAFTITFFFSLFNIFFLWHNILTGFSDTGQGKRTSSLLLYQI